MERFWFDVTEGGTKACEMAHPTGFDCSVGKPDAHHFVRKSRLATDEAKQDPRNGVCLCRWHHQMVEAARLDCPRPPLLDEFLHEHGLLESGRPDPKRRAA